MKHITIDLDPELEIMLKLEAMRQQKPVTEVIRETLKEKFVNKPRPQSKYIGAFDSGRSDTAERHEELLGEWGFGEDG